VLPESLPVERRAPKLHYKTANPFGAIALLRSHPALLGLSAINFIGYIAHEVYPTVFVLYVMNRYNWSEGAIGTALAVVGISSIVISAGVVGPVVKKLGERTSLHLGLALGAIGFWLFGWAGTGLAFIVSIPVNSLWGLSGPPTQTLMTQLVPSTRQGELQGALGSLRSIAMLAGPGVFSGVYAAFAKGSAPVPGAPWYLACLMLLVSIAVARAVLKEPAAEPVAS
jgi:DHA1 family tetracycline resistance protein-like MFS transporter